jgi:type VI secretion system secreted protein VgrG
MPFTQEQRQFAVTSPLDDDVLLLQRLSGAEQLSGLFEFTLDLLSENHLITANQVLGKSFTVRADLQNENTRHFNGLAVGFSHTGGHLGLSSYRVVLRPWLWFLTRTADCRIFQDQTVPDIIMSVFRDHGFTDITNSLSQTYAAREYCVQYRETSFNFVSRLMETEGIYYYFTHAEGKHTLVLADGYGAHSANPGYKDVPYYPPDEFGRRETENLDNWSVSLEIPSGKYVHTDYNFTTPRTGMASNSANILPYGHADGEVYDYPGDYAAPDDGEGLARIRIEELQAQYELFHGHGDVRGLSPGALFTLDEHPVSSYNQQYLVTKATYVAVAASYTGSADDGDSFVCEIEATKSSLTFRAPRKTPRPVVRGPQTAFVVGKAGEEIWTDEHGRVKVQFHWDRVGTKDENSSCWLRVAQLWAGKSWGAMFVPRIGHEVIVDFLEGDPDRPIVTGRVYNGDNKAPYALPAKATVSTIMSNTSKGGGGSNELRFEDDKGNEEIFMHAQKDFNTVVENDDTLKVKHDQTIEIENDRTETVKTGNETVTIKQGNRSVTVSTGNDKLTVSAGNYTIDVSAGKMSVTAAQAIELTVGGSSIKIEPSQVTISSVMVKIAGQAQTEVSGAMTKISGSGMVQVSGGIIMIG